jgi:cytochrome-b5 reductase
LGEISEDDILMKHELAKLENDHPLQLRVFYLLDKPPKEWKGNAGYITEDLLKQTMPSEGNVKIFVCGFPPSIPLICSFSPLVCGD